MITETRLKEICENYGIDYKKLVKNNSNILYYGEYGKICATLDFLRNEVHIEVKNIEKCPSILYFSTENIRDNWKFLNESNIMMSDVETSLHILSTENKQLQETYNYIMDNYGPRYLKAITSILRVPVSRIKEIENKFGNYLKQKNILRAAYSRHTVEEIEKIVNVCRENKIPITGTVFHRTAEEIEKIVEVCEENEIPVTGRVFNRTAEEIEKIVKVCEENEIPVTGSVFNRTAEEIEKIVEVCKKNEIPITGNVFLRTAEEIEEIVEVCKENEIPITGSVFRKIVEEIEKIVNVCRENKIPIAGNVFSKTAEEIEKIVEVCKENEIPITGSVFYRKAEEIEKIVEVCKENEIPITGNVFLKTAEEIEEIVEVCKENKIPITGSVFSRTAEEIEKIVEVCKENKIPITGSVFFKTAKEIEKIVEVCKENKIQIIGSIFLKSAKQLEENIEYIRDNFGEEYLTPGVLSKSNENLKQTLPYLKELGVLGMVKISPTILTLKLSEIQERIGFIQKIGEPIVKSDGSGFNSILTWTRKKYAKRVKEYDKISSQDIGKATYMVAVEQCDEADGVIQGLVAEQVKQDIIQNRSNE